MVISNVTFPLRHPLELMKAKVHVWHASLEQPLDLIRKLETVLSEEERLRAEEFRLLEHCRSFIVRRGILRYLLSRYTGIQPEQIQFKYTLTGKPYLANNREKPDLCFNLSHTGPLVLYAFSSGRQVGIDVESLRPIEDMDQIASRCFSTGEYRNFQGISQESRLRAFYNCWTRKEAFIKATGDGMYFPLQDFEVSFEPHFRAELLSIAGSREKAKQWSMHDLKTWDGYAAALVVEGNDYSISHKQWAYPSILLETTVLQE